MPSDEQGGPIAPSQEEPTTVVSIQEGIRARMPNAAYSEPAHLDVREVWDAVRPGLEEILQQNPQLTFRPEDVYAELLEKRSLLFMSKAGWMVLSVEIDQFTGDRTLLIWLAYTFKVGGHQWSDHQEWLNLIAAGEGCRFIEARSAVPELVPYAMKHGWTLETNVYRREVEVNGK